MALLDEIKAQQATDPDYYLDEDDNFWNTFEKSKNSILTKTLLCTYILIFAPKLLNIFLKMPSKEQWKIVG